MRPAMSDRKTLFRALREVPMRTQFIAAAALVLVSACEPTRPTMMGEAQVIPAEVFLNVGDTVTLRFQAGDGTQVLEHVTWSVDDSSVAEISLSGLLSAVGIGTTLVHGSSGAAVGTASVMVGPLMLGSWHGQSDTVGLYLRFNASSTPNAFTGLGSITLGAQPGIYVSAWGSAFRDSVRFTGGGDGIAFDYAGAFTQADEVRGTIWLNQTMELALTLGRIEPRGPEPLTAAR